MIRFRSTISTGAAPRVDPDKGTIHGASAIQAVEALGHDMLVDEVMLRQVADKGNALGKVKSRFTHPGMCSDAMGKQLGHASNFRVEGGKTLADLQFLDASAKSPAGDLRSYVLALAKESPTDFGLSIVFSGTSVWKLQDGREIKVDDPSLRRGHGDDAYFTRHPDATTDKPFARCEELYAVDVVDEPAANRDGLFSAAAFSSTTGELAEQAFAWLDEFRSLHGLGFDKLADFFTRYRASRAAPPTTPTESPMKLSARLAALATVAALAPLILKELSADKPADEIDILHNVHTAHAEALSKQITDLQTQLAKAGTDHAAALKAETDKATALAAQVKELQGKVERFNRFEHDGNQQPDPGTDANAGKSGNDQVDGERFWSESAEARAFFHNDKATFTAAVSNDGLAAVKKQIPVA